MAIGALLALGAMMVGRKFRDTLDVQRQVYLEHLAPAKADRATAEKMAAEVDRAIKDGRVSFSGTPLDRETHH